MQCSVFLLAGFATTIAVSAVGPLVAPWFHSNSLIASDSWSFRRQTRGALCTTYGEESTSPPDSSRQSQARSVLKQSHAARFEEAPDFISWAPGHYPHYVWTLHESGWPARTLWGWTYFDPVILAPSARTSAGLLYLSPEPDPWFDTGTSYPLPYLPLWSGLILNTIFYAAICWGLLALPRLIRRTIRVRRGHCPRCAYDMHGLPNTPCPECGHAFRVTSPAGASPPSRPA